VLVISATSDVTVANTVFTANSVDNGYGGVISTNSNSSFTNCSFDRNTAGYGGAIEYLAPAIITAINSSFSSNRAAFAGAIVHSNTLAAPAVLSDNTYDNNTAYCCYAKEFTSHPRAVGTTCIDIDYRVNILSECCPAGTFSNGEKCQLCTDELTCSNTTGATTSTLSLAAGLWRTSTDTLTVYSCLNSDACSGGIALTSTDDYCATGYKGPCKYTSVYILYTYMMLAVDCNFMECVYVSTMKPLYNT
jgi:hypothetical protein